MPRIYCNQCFSSTAAARDQLRGSPLNHISEFICQQGHALPRQLLDRHEMNAPALTRFLYNRAPVPELLGSWINAVNGPERADRMEAVDRLHAQGALLAAGDQVVFVNGNVDLSNLIHLTELPPKLHISGNLDITGCRSLLSFPQMLYIQGSLTVKGCHALDELSSGQLNVSGNTYISECNNMKALSHGGIIAFNGNAFIERCPELRSIAATATCQGSLSFSYCPELKETPISMVVDHDLSFHECAKLIRIGENYSVGGDLSITSCSQYAVLPQAIHLGGELDISNNPCLNTFPNWVLNLPNLLNVASTHTAPIGELPSQIQPSTLLNSSNNYAYEQYGMGDQDLASFADTFNSNNRNLNIASELQPELAHIYGDLDADGDINIDIDMDMADSTLQVETTPGNELQDLLVALKQNPLGSLNVTYKGNKAIDGGAVRKQAVDFALQQLFADESLVVKHSNGQYMLNVDTTSLGKKREFLDKAHELGLILGQMVVLQNATGHGFRPEVDRNIYDALQFLNKIAINSSKTAHDYVLELAESPDEKRLVKLVKEVMKTQFKDKTQLDYLKSLPFDDLEDYTAEAAAYLIIANEMQMSGVFVPDDFDEFKDTFAGPSDPNALMIENLKYVPTRYSDKNTRLANKLVEWVTQAVNDASKDQMKRLNLDLTGASFTTEKLPIYLQFSAFNDNRFLFNSHSCSRELDVNYTRFKQLVDQSRFDIFKYDFLNAGGGTFNGS
ncbi:MAG: YabP/YqfC family sporulation protein [Pseudomonadota bacterium]|nr:YabP/YqfC family sporulation protein [Pseudomonadota bacterium]